VVLDGALKEPTAFAINGRRWIRTSDFHRVRMAEKAKIPGK
jgi:hypothetical protein